MDYLKRLLINLALIVGMGLIVYLGAPKFFDMFFQTLYALIGPLVFVLLIAVALPAKRKYKVYANSKRRADNVAGASTHKLADKRYVIMLIFGFVGLGVLSLMMALVNNAKAIGMGGIGILVVLIALKIVPELFMKRIDQKSKEVVRARKGAHAEERVDDLFAALSNDYFIINDVVSKFGNIDHVIIKKDAGIFLIETKSHHGKISVEDKTIYLNGHLAEKDFIAQTLNNSFWLRDKVKELFEPNVWIYPIIVFTNAFVPFMPPVKGINIVNVKFLIRTIEKINNTNALNEQLWEKREAIFRLLKGT
jgi:hypothetical protein